MTNGTPVSPSPTKIHLRLFDKFLFALKIYKNIGEKNEFM